MLFLGALGLRGMSTVTSECSWLINVSKDMTTSEVGLLKCCYGAFVQRGNIKLKPSLISCYIPYNIPPPFPLFHAQMPSSSQQVNLHRSWTPSPEVILSTRTSPSKLVKVSFQLSLMIDASTFYHVTTIPQVAHQFKLETNTTEAEAQELQWKLADITNQEEDTNNTEACHQSKAKQVMLIRMNNTMRKPMSSMQVIALSCFTPYGFEMEKEPSRLNVIQSQRKQNTLRMSRIRFKDKSRRSRWFLGCNCQVKCPLKHGLWRWWVTSLNNT